MDLRHGKPVTDAGLRGLIMATLRDPPGGLTLAGVSVTACSFVTPGNLELLARSTGTTGRDQAPEPPPRARGSHTFAEGRRMGARRWVGFSPLPPLLT